MLSEVGFFFCIVYNRSLMTTFNTPFGRYIYLRLPMGICSAPEVFHKNVYQQLENLKGMAVYIDDIIV